MKRVIMTCAAVTVMLAGGARAQVSEADYPQYYDYIIDHDWSCLTKQDFSEVQGNVIESNADFHFERKNAYEAYRFVGHGSQVLTVDGQDYHSTFNLEGFGINDSSFGTGITIVSTQVTSGDPLPNGWTWNPADYVSLHMVQDKPEYKYPYYLAGSDNTPNGLVTYECVVKES